jgi:hypothetical protein
MNTQASSGMDDFSPSCAIQDLSWLEPSHFDFLDESPDFIRFESLRISSWSLKLCAGT